jgi:hypothetical protein
MFNDGTVQSAITTGEGTSANPRLAQINIFDLECGGNQSGDPGIVIGGGREMQFSPSFRVSLSDQSNL